MKKFDFVIGNPPYQEETVGENETYAPQLYYRFMDESYKVGKAVELIHPGRFLFNAGSTPKSWNQKMLHDKHFKIMEYNPDAKKYFNGIEITGGIAISYYDESEDFGEIGVFTPFNQLNTTYRKVISRQDFVSMESIVVTRTVYRLTDKLHEDYPDAISQLSKGHAYDMSSNIFERLPQVFYDEKPNDGCKYIRMLGRKNGNRAYMFLRRDYAKNVDNLDKYKIVLARADGAAGTVGNPVPARIIGAPSIEPPGTGTTESFLSIGAFSTLGEAEAALKYNKSRFLRALVGILKVTQDTTPEKWRFVPLQDFTPSSDIDWSASVADIDQQLYKKYGLSQAEIDFIETHVKEMS